MLRKNLFAALLLVFGISACQAQNSKDDIRAIAETFIKGADQQQGTMLQEVLHPESKQFVHLGGKVSVITAEQYIQLIDAKKLGGTPRKIKFKQAYFVRNNLAVVELNALSNKFDFQYHLSLVKSAEGQWQIVGIMAEVAGV